MKSVTLSKILTFAALLFGMSAGKALASCSSSMPYTFNATSYLSYVTTNANNNFLLACVSTVDNTQIGGAGLYASQIIPTTSGQATFGGSQTYAFPAAISVANGGSFGSTLTTNGISDSGGITTSKPVASGSSTANALNAYSSGCATLGLNSGSAVVAGIANTAQGFYCNGSSTLLSALDSSGNVGYLGNDSTIGVSQQDVSGTFYVRPYDAQSTSASLNTHIEHGTLTTAAASGGFACAASHNFTHAFTSAPSLSALAGSGQGAPFILYINSKSASAFQICAEGSGLGSYIITFDWWAIGE